MFLPALRNLSTPVSNDLRMSSSRARRAGLLIDVGAAAEFPASARAIGAALRFSSHLMSALYPTNSSPTSATPSAMITSTLGGNITARAARMPPPRRQRRPGLHRGRHSFDIGEIHEPPPSLAGAAALPRTDVVMSSSAVVS